MQRDDHDEYTVERHRRGFLGSIFLALFAAWNIAMAAWLGSFIYRHVNSGLPSDNGAFAGVLGVFILILSIWALGAVITGLLALLTRGSKTIVYRETGRPRQRLRNDPRAGDRR